MKKRFKLLTVIVCIALAMATFGAFAGCNGYDNGNGPPPPPPPPPGTLLFSGTTLEHGFMGVAMTVTLPGATAAGVAAADQPDIEYELTFGQTLPAGLTLNENTLVLSGTPTEEVTEHTFSVGAFAEYFTSATATFTISIFNPNEIGFLDVTIHGPINEPLTHNLVASTHSGTNITFATTDTMPNGLTLDADGRIHGTPTVAGSTTIEIIASADGYGDVAAQVTITITDTATFTFGVQHADLDGFVGNSIFYGGLFTSWYTLERTGANPGRPFNSTGFYDPNGYFLEGTSSSTGSVIWRVWSTAATTATLRMSLGTIVPNANVTMHSGAGGGGNLITLNGLPVEYGPLALPRRVLDVDAVEDEYSFMGVTIPFAQFEMATINLVAGLNTFAFSVSSNDWDDLIDPEPIVPTEANPWGVAIENIQIITNATLAWYSEYLGPRDSNLDYWYRERLGAPRPATSLRPFATLPRVLTSFN